MIFITTDLIRRREHEWEVESHADEDSLKENSTLLYVNNLCFSLHFGSYLNATFSLTVSRGAACTCSHAFLYRTDWWESADSHQTLRFTNIKLLMELCCKDLDIIRI